MDSVTVDISQLVNTEIYPLHLANEDPNYLSFVSNFRSHLVHDGIATLPNFLRNDVLCKAVAQIRSLTYKAWKTDSSHNIFLDDGDEDFPMDHIRNRRLPTTVASLAYDYLDKENVLRLLYQNEKFLNFIRQVLDLPTFHRLADPLGACSVNIFKPGMKHSWHFDESQFSTTLMLQKPEEGGLFQYTKPIRGICGDKRESKIQMTEKESLARKKQFEMLDKLSSDQRMDLVDTLTFEPGTLSIFQGNQCLHRVTKCGGNRDRLVAIFCFSTRQGVKNSSQVQKLFWGREK